MAKAAAARAKKIKHKSYEDKARILQCCLNGIPWKQIRKDFSTNNGTIGRILKKFNTLCLIDRKPGSGRPRKTTTTEDRRIVREVKKNPFVTSTEINNDLQSPVSARTIRRRITESGEFKSYWAARKPFISEGNIKRRLAWCYDHVHWSIAQWRRVIFSDESPFVLRYNSKKRVWRRANERYEKKHCVGTVKHDIKIMVWGCFAAHGVGMFHRVVGLMEQVQYGNILVNCAFPSIDLLFGGPSDVLWQQDNDPKHTSKWCQRILAGGRLWGNEHEYPVVTKLDWPSQSPDLNPIENLWSILDQNLKDRHPNNADQLFEILKEGWYALPADLLDRLACSMPDRIRDVIAAKGGHTKW